jgi:hypothetical protein
VFMLGPLSIDLMEIHQCQIIKTEPPTNHKTLPQ